VVPSLYPHPQPRGRSASFPKRLKQPSNSLYTAHGRRSPGPLTGDRGGSTFGQMVEPAGRVFIVAAEHRIECAADYLHVLLRHRLPRQPEVGEADRAGPIANQLRHLAVVDMK
jgi:hypothetical protein